MLGTTCFFYDTKLVQFLRRVDHWAQRSPVYKNNPCLSVKWFSYPPIPLANHFLEKLMGCWGIRTAHPSNLTTFFASVHVTFPFAHKTATYLMMLIGFAQAPGLVKWIFLNLRSKKDETAMLLFSYKFENLARVSVRVRWTSFISYSRVNCDSLQLRNQYVDHWNYCWERAIFLFRNLFCDKFKWLKLLT